MKADFHMHTRFSTDAQSEPEDMVKEAIRLGLETICFTDHQDKDFPGDKILFALDPDAYFKEMRALQEKYKDQLDIRIGIEMGLQPHLGQYTHDFVNSYPFDFVIGSVHLVDGKDPYDGALFAHQTDEAAYRQAFEETLENIRQNQDFDVLGHLDYVVRYGKHQERDYEYARYADLIDRILKYLIENGKGIELNTAGLKYGLPFAHPIPDVLKRYRELGGEILTVGADGHKPEHIAYDFWKVDDLLRSCGFKYYTEYKGRKPVFKQLP